MIPTVLVISQAATWSTPAWALLMVLVGGLLSLVVTMFVYLLRRADRSRTELEAERHESLLRSVNSIDEKLSHIDQDFNDFRLEAERRLSRVEGAIFRVDGGAGDVGGGGG